MLASTVNSKVTFTKSVITRYLLALTREQRGVSVSFCEVQEHPSFPRTKIFTLCFFCEVGVGLTSLLWNLSPTFPCLTD